MASEAVVFVLDGGGGGGSGSGGSAADDDISPATKTSATLETTTAAAAAERKLETAAAKSPLGCCKEAVSNMLVELLLQSAHNIASVIVCRSLQSCSHDVDPPVPHLRELTYNGLMPPTLELLQSVRDIEEGQTAKATEEEEGKRENCNNRNSSENVGGGDLWAGIALAADRLYQKTRSRKACRRKIVVFTDLSQSIRLEPTEVIQVIDKLRSMSVRLEVIRLDVELSGVYDVPKEAKREDQGNQDGDEGASGRDSKASHVKVKEEENDGSDDGTDSDDGESDDDEEEEEEDRKLLICKKHKERFLISLTERTGGVLSSFINKQNTLETNKGRRIKKGQRNKVELSIAPGLKVDAKYSLLMGQEKVPSLKKEAMLLEDDGSIMKNALGEIMTDGVQYCTLHIEKEKDENTPVLRKDQTSAVSFGPEDLIPWGHISGEGIQRSTLSTTKKMEILGYVALSSLRVSKTLLIGPPHIVTGSSSLKACALISALAQALEREKKVAICTFFKAGSIGTTYLGALFPGPESTQQREPVHLVFLKLPYKGDVKHLQMEPFEDLDADKLRVCEDMIESLMLPDDVRLGAAGSVPAPAVRSWNQTVIERALDPENKDLVYVRSQRQLAAEAATDGGGGGGGAKNHDHCENDDPIRTPGDVMHRSKDALERFHSEFSFKASRNSRSSGERKGKKKGKKVHHYRDFL